LNVPKSGRQYISNEYWKMAGLNIREAKLSEAEAIASLHAASWMTAYRGLLSDKYLDNDLEGERRKYWLKKMPEFTNREFVLVAEEGGELIGFVAVLDKPEAGFDALVDNLHVRPDLKGRGIGGKLLNAVAARLLDTQRKSFYLFVLKGNTGAENFYLAKGGTPLDILTHDFGGKTVQATRFAWEQLDRMR
jgi:ribosomal protein S18 acetylase RimI-like enzyme